MRRKRRKIRKYKEEDIPKRLQRQRKKRVDDDYEMLKPNLSPVVKRWIVIVVVFGLAVLSILAVLGGAGKLGGYLRQGLFLLFGWSAPIFPFVMLFLGYFLLTHKKRNLGPAHYIGFVLLVLSYSGLLHLFVLEEGKTVIAQGRGGGYLGYAISYPLNQLMGVLASSIVLIVFLLVAFLIIFESWIAKVKDNGLEAGAWWRLKGVFSGWRERFQPEEDAEDSAQEREQYPEGEGPETNQDKEALVSVPHPAREAVNIKNDRPSFKKNLFSQASPEPFMPKIEIPIKLLNEKGGKAKSGDVEASKMVIQKTLANFGISVEMGEVSVGPTVTQYTLKPAEGVKLSQITTLQNDLALALAAHPIRIEAPIPGKSLVGIEVPNRVVAIVTLREILEHDTFKQRKSNLSVVLGKDVAGQPWIADLGKMPHLLVAGSTGSGKTVCLNTIIISLLYQNNPEELKFILIDPKRVELTAYNGIPHLLTPAITDVGKTISALKWAIGEMERRFHVLSEVGKRDIYAYNAVAPEKMPVLVIVIDELADLMSASAAEVEALIIRLAQMARAVGIHLLMATQRPSVDVITGLIKANITSRVAFSVASIMDSRTILDTSGAEKLLGRGDMLYISAALSKPKRLQGAYLSDHEIERVVHYLRERGEPDYNAEIVETTQIAGRLGGASGVDVASGDELLENAKETVMWAGKASASLLQRRLRVGYARAARLLDLLEEQGIVGPADGAKPREVLKIPDDGTTAEVAEEDEEEGEYEDDEEEEDN
ncbi:DNA translocase FtsK [Patescibacteria group bacterium]|nr:DNA translocase FtsK [Patescibacteria group bacterium]MBU4512185.1 DNA translocase FtsK [Patescibacteria group bacterium]